MNCFTALDSMVEPELLYSDIFDMFTFYKISFGLATTQNAEVGIIFLKSVSII